jgi:hypothetical protein
MGFLTVDAAIADRQAGGAKFAVWRDGFAVKAV